LVKADYSQIELRIAAELSGDERMLAAFAHGDDLHTLTASSVLGEAPDAVTKEDRQLAKAFNFGLVYGVGPAAFADYAQTAYGLTLTNDEAKTLRDRFLAAYPGLKRWHRSQPAGAVEVRTASGRRRVVERFTEKLNTPVQGTEADGLKLALALMWETRHRCPSAVPLLVVHDEVVIDCDADEAERARDWLVDCMQSGMQQFVRQAPVTVEALICRDWSGTPV
jgi:DNA polymerase-1